MVEPVCKKKDSHLKREHADPRRKMAETIMETGGNLCKTAYYLSLSRNHVYFLVNDWKLWPVVNEARRNKIAKRKKEIRRGFGKHEAVTGALPGD